jgi:hypothetical protein
VIGVTVGGGLAGCAEITVPDLNNASVASFQTNPTAAGANALAVGLFRGARDNTASLVETLGMFGREGYEMSGARGDLPLYLIGPLSPTTFYLGWGGQYADVRAANILLDALGRVGDLTAPQKEAMSGFVQTMEAYDLTQVAMTRDTFGMPIAVDVTPTSAPAPIATKADAYQHIYNLLDSAQAHLQTAQAGGDAFSFQVPAGFAPFSKPSTFLTLNRALRVRVDLLLNDYTTALTDLTGSFISPTGALDGGAFFDYSNNSGDEQNPRFQPYYYAEPSLATNAQLQVGGTLRDARLLAKTDSVTSFTFDNNTSDRQFTIYTGTASSLAMIRNEELILMRAEAELGAGMTTAALNDINIIRTESGNLPMLPAPPADFVGELLYEKRYSLLWEGGHSWIDYRQHNRLTTLPNQFAPQRFFLVLPFPLSDCQARSPQPSGCVSVAGDPANTPGH